jgi:hypothetical protein
MLAMGSTNGVLTPAGQKILFLTKSRFLCNFFQGDPTLLSYSTSGRGY